MFTFDTTGLSPLIATLSEKLSQMNSMSNPQRGADIQGYLFSMEALIKENKQEIFFAKRPLLQGEYMLLVLLSSFDESIHIPTLFKEYLHDRLAFIHTSAGT